MRQKAIVLAIVAVLIVGIAGTFIFNKSQSVMAGVSDKLETELSKALGSEVAVGSLEIVSLNKVSLYDVTVRDGRGQALAVGGKVTVAYDPLSLLWGRAAVSAVRELTLSAPQIFLVREPDGKWNIDDLLAKTRGEDSAFSGKITLQQGTVNITMPEGRWQVDGIAGSLDFARKPDIALQLTAAYRGGPLELTGRVSSEGSSMLALSADNLALDGLEALVPTDLAVRPAGGKIGKLQVILRRDKGTITFAGEAKLAGAGADIASLPVRELNGSISFSDKQIFLFPTAAKIYGQDIEVRGTIATATAAPVLGLTVTSAKFDPAALGRDLPVSGPFSFTAAIGGTPSRPVVSGEVRLAKGEVGGYAVAAGVAKFSLVETALTLKQLEADMLGGHVMGSGTVLIDKKSYNLVVNGQDINFAALPDIGGEITGRGDIDLRLEGTDNLAAAKVAGTARMRAGQISGIPFATLSGGFYKNGGAVTVDYLNLDFPGGTGVLSARGTVNNGRLALTFFGQGIPLSMAADQVGGLDLAGTADAEGTVGGTTENPELTANFTARNGQAMFQPFTVAQGGLTLTRAALTLRAVEASNGLTKHRVDGSVGLTGHRELNLTIATRQARAENLVKLIMPGEKLTGNVDNEVTLTGPLSAFTAAGRVKLTEGSFRGQLVARAEGTYRRQGGIIELQDFVIDSLNAQVRLAGTIDADNRINLDVSARDIDLARVHVSFPYPVGGEANFNGKLTGTLAGPVFDGEIAAKSLKLNGQVLTAVGGRLIITSDSLEIPNFSFSQGEGKFVFAGGIEFQPGTIYGNLSAQGGGVAGLLAILNVPAKDVDGRLDGQITVGGTVSKPNIWLTGTLTRGKIKNYPLENIDVDVVLNNNVVTVNQFYAKQGGGVLAMRGTAALNGPLDLEVSGRGLDVGLLTAWLDTTIDTQGKLTFTAQVTGTTYSPHAAVSLEISGGGVTNATFDDLYGLFILDKGSIHVNQLLLSKGPYRASAYGTIPLAALNREGRTRASIADQMDLKVRLEQANLSILPLLSKEVAWASGETKGEVTIGGTLVQPSLSGSIVVTDGTIKVKSLADPVQKVGVDIRFEGDKINIISFDGNMGGGSYRLTGSAALNGLALADYRMLLVLDKLGVNHKYFQGPLNGTLTVSANGGGKPLLSGNLVFENMTANVPFIPNFAPSGLNLGLDLEVVAGKRVRLHNPYLYDLWVEGKAKFTGTTLAPVASGRFAAERGTVNYLRTQFRVNHASADFNQFGSLLPVIRLNAETKLEVTKVNLAVTGPLDAMTFRLTSEPAMGQQQILSLLTLRGSYSDRQGQSGGSNSGLGRDELIGLLDAGLQMTFVVEAESAFRKSFGLDEFRLVKSTLSGADGINSKSSSADQTGYNIAIGKYVTDRLYMSYTMGVDHKETSAYIRYDLSKRVSFTGAVDELNRRRIGIETRFNF